MRRLSVIFAVLVVLTTVLSGLVQAAGPSGSKECHVQDDDCDGLVNEDTGTAVPDDLDGDGRVDEDPVGDANGDGNPDDDLDGKIDEDVPDDDGDGKINEDPPGNAVNNPTENQVDCNEQNSQVSQQGINVYAGANGLEVCDDGGTTPIDGRVIVSKDGYASIDGDNSNPGAGNGYARVDQNGPHCGNEANQDSSASQSGNSNAQADCG
jgi:hypothetical protein